MSVNVKLGNETINNVDTVRLRSADTIGEYCEFQEKIEVPYVEYTLGGEGVTQYISSCKAYNFLDIPVRLFGGYGDLKSVDLSSCQNLDTICNNAFQQDTQLQTVIFPPSVRRIEGAAFYLCYVVNIDSLPPNLTFIGWQAFQQCSKVTISEIPPTVSVIQQSAFRECVGIKQLTIPPMVSILEANTFYACWNLESVVMGGQITVIRSQCFGVCTKLMSITINQQNPPQLFSDALTNVPPTCAIYVPSDSVDTYKAATNWSARADYIQAIPQE